MDLSDRFSLLHFIKNQQWWPLPGWARFFLDLGVSLASVNVEKCRYTVALALPTRSYAAAFIGSGFSYANLFYRSYEDAEYLEFIYSLPEGTSVKFYDNGKVIKAIKKDIHEYNGKLHVGIQIEGSATKYILPNNVRKIEVADQNYDSLPNRQVGRSVILPSELLNALIPDKVNEFVYRTRIDGVVVGTRNTLDEESRLPVAILSGEKKMVHEGCLYDLFRVEGFNPRSVGHRYTIHPPNSNNPSIASRDDLTPDSVVIFDGALGFLKLHETYKRHNWIVILDHTDTNFINAAAQINQEHLYRSETALDLSHPHLPSGVEMMFFARDL